jgi:chromosome condensin MukBEF MukE localization factor
MTVQRFQSRCRDGYEFREAVQSILARDGEAHTINGKRREIRNYFRHQPGNQSPSNGVEMNQSMYR